LFPAASAANYLNVANAPATGIPYISVSGSDTNINMALLPKGSGQVQIYAASGQVPQLAANGADANHDLVLIPKGTGKVKVNDGVVQSEIVSLTGTQTLTNKTLTNPSLTSPRADLLYHSTLGTPILYLDGPPGGVNFFQLNNNTAGNWPTMFAAGSDTNIGMNLSPKGTGIVLAGGVPVVTTTDIQTLTNKTLTDPKVNGIFGTNGTPVAVIDGQASGVNYLILQNNVAGSSPAIYSSGPGTNLDLHLIPKGTGVVKANGVEVATISGIQTLTNKTLTTPKIDYIKDTNGNLSVALEAVGSATNYVSLTNNSTGNAPQVKAVGTDTNIDLSVIAKGSGIVTLQNGTAQFLRTAAQTNSVNYPLIYASATGVPVYFGAEGTDTNIDLNLFSKGTGKVKANLVEIATISDIQTLTNKTLTDPKISNVKDTYGNYILGLAGSATAVNFLGVSNALAGASPGIYSDGTDTNVDLRLTTKGTGVVKANNVEVATISGTQTLTNKRVQPRIGTVASTATPSIDCTLYDQYNITALAAAITSITITGTPYDGQILRIRFKDNGTIRAIAHGSSFVAGPAALLTTTAANKTHLSEYTYDAAAAKWACTLVHVAGY
jgi:hypothetical protein